MKCIRMTVPDIEKGGKQVGSGIVGAKKVQVVWSVEGDNSLYSTKQDAHTRELSMELNRELHNILETNLLRIPLPSSGMIALIKGHLSELKLLLQKPRFKDIIESTAKTVEAVEVEQTGVEQVKQVKSPSFVVRDDIRLPVERPLPKDGQLLTDLLQ